MEKKLKIKLQKRMRRKKRVRSKIQGSSKTPRLSVFRSLKYIYAQLINDEKGETLISVSDQEIKKGKGKVGKANEVGKLLAKKALDKGIKNVVFDRSQFKYAGRVKALAEGAREGGLNF